MNINRRIIRTIETIRYLKPAQVLYRVKYNLSPARKLTHHYFSGDLHKNFTLIELPEQKNILSFHDGTCSVDILNLRKTYSSAINWGDLEYGRLWNYNLQYADFLNQSNLSVDKRKELLLDLYKWLTEGKIAPEPYPSSLRIMNIVRFYNDHYSDSYLVPELLNSLYSELCFLSGRLEYHLSANHLLENAFALLMGGTYLKNKTWIKKAIKILTIELREQILDDGAHYERSAMYHNIILFRILEAVSYTDDRSDLHLFLRNIAAKMISWTKKMMFRNGHMPHVNDSADGVAFTSDSLIRSAKQLSINTELEAPLKSSGYRVFKTQPFELITDVDGINPSHQPGHAHADSLSFLLNVNGEPIVVDPGTSTYEFCERRQWERSTLAHNTVTVNNENTADVWQSFRVGRRPDVQILHETNASVTAQLSCKRMNGGNFTHKRHFSVNHDDLIIEDETAVSEIVTGRLYFAPGIKVTVENPGITIRTPSQKVLLAFENVIDTAIFEYGYALGFNNTTTSSGIAYQFKNKCRLLFNEGKT
ncbi:MAG: hypothetical protein EA359_16090 [Balneolaceae bacterium]|nr:MAG: hypothetical protein EA359_16090 [Balneolaceae bacterium]